VKKADYPVCVCAEVTRLLTEERERQGISENSLATKAGLSQSLMTRFKRNLNSPNLDSLLRISIALDVDLGKVLSRAIRTVKKATGSKNAS
jgi:transcriptional regulator with XRE-family HTH domain